MESGIVEAAAAGFIALSFFIVFFVTWRFTRSLMTTAEDAERFESAMADTPTPGHDALLEMTTSIVDGDERVDANFARDWARKLSGEETAYVSFLLEVAGATSFPDELPATSRETWAFSRLTPGRRIALILNRHLDKDGLSTLAREGVAHEESVEVAHEYLSLWEGSAVADVERELAEDDRERHREAHTGDVGVFDGSLQLAQAGPGGELTVTHEEGALSKVED